MLTYLLYLTLCWGLLYLLYQVLFRHTTFFSHNRAYLLVSLVLGLLLPAIDWAALLPAQEVAGQAGYYLEPITIGMQRVEVVVTAQTAARPSTEAAFSWGQILWAVYFLGAFAAAARLGYGIFQLIRLYRSSRCEKREGYTMVYTGEVHTPFSFFRLLFWSEVLPCPSTDRDKILCHERAHMQEWHSVDVLLLELLSVIFWFHPLLYLYNRSLRTIHEYQADAAVLHTARKKQYGHLLLRQSQTGQAVALANHFSHTQLKKRIIMMTRKKSPRLQQLWYALALPLIAGLAFTFAAPPTQAAPAPAPALQLEGDAKVMPVFKGCETEATAEAQQACSNKKLIEFVASNLKYPEQAKEAGKEGMVVVSFTISKEGAVTRAKVVKSAGYGMDEAALAVVEAMPRWTPGKDEDGKAVATKLTLPISFKLPSDPLEGEVFKVVEEMPRFPGCEEETEAETRKKCWQQKLLEFVYDNLKYPEEARTAGISGMAIVQFIVDKAGHIKNTKIVRSIGGGTDEAVLEVIENMPDWIPGKQRGRPVNVEFNLPIRFQLPAATDTAEEELREVEGQPEKPKEDIEEVEETPSKTEEAPSNSSDLFKVAEEMPRFPGCEEITGQIARKKCSDHKMLEFVYSNIKYPQDARDAGAQGVSVLRLVIGKDGEVENYELARPLHPALNTEVLRIGQLIKDEIQWIPARQKGEPVKVEFLLPVKFKMDEEKAGKLEKTDKESPLFVIDGEPYPELNSSDMGDFLQPDDIESIVVLKGDKAVSKYGKAGKEGVLEITTKSGQFTTEPQNMPGYGDAAEAVQDGQTLQLQNFLAAPNPVQDELNVQFEGPAAATVVRIIDANGRELLRRDLPQFDGYFLGTFDLSRWSAGVLVLQVQQGDAVFAQKLILK